MRTALSPIVDKRRGAIGRRIIILVLVSIALSVVLLTSVFIVFQLRQALQERRASVESTSYILASAVADAVVSNDRNKIFDALRAIRRLPNIRRAVVIGPNGNEIAMVGSAWMLDGDVVDDSTSLVGTLSRGWFAVSTSIVQGGRDAGQLILIADISGLPWQIAAIMLGTLASALLAACIGAAAASRLTRRIAGPIETLTHAITEIRNHRNYSTKVQHFADDETGILVTSFNGMMADIEYRDESLRHLAYFDPLTGLGNRQEFQRHFQEVLNAIPSRSCGAALVLLDLDQFKLINDSFGHSTGDALLMEVAARFTVELPADASLCRLGGDEFALIVPGASNSDEIQKFLAPLVATLHRPIELSGRSVEINVSGGVALIPENGTTIADLLRRADLALYSAKHAGRGRVHFFRTDLEEEMRTAAEIAHDLKTTLIENQFQLHYQPQVDLTTGRIVGFECLLRWRHPSRGFVSPAKFIPIAEGSGLICDVGRWVLDAASRQAREWTLLGFDFGQLAVNVSISQIKDATFRQDIERTLRENDLRGSALCLELTESVFAGESLDWIRKSLSGLKETGVSLALDDFGTGYSSLSYLKNLPFGKLKVDRAFVQAVHVDPSKRKLLQGIIDLGHALDMTIIAEGAEEQAEVEVLCGMRADQVQGYFFGRPLPADHVIAHTNKFNARQWSMQAA